MAVDVDVEMGFDFDLYAKSCDGGSVVGRGSFHETSADGLEGNVVGDELVVLQFFLGPRTSVCPSGDVHRLLTTRT